MLVVPQTTVSRSQRTSGWGVAPVTTTPPTPPANKTDTCSPAFVGSDAQGGSRVSQYVFMLLET